MLPLLYYLNQNKDFALLWFPTGASGSARRRWVAGTTGTKGSAGPTGGSTKRLLRHADHLFILTLELFTLGRPAFRGAKVNQDQLERR